MHKHERDAVSSIMGQGVEGVPVAGREPEAGISHRLYTLAHKMFSPPTGSPARTRQAARVAGYRDYYVLKVSGATPYRNRRKDLLVRSVRRCCADWLAASPLYASKVTEFISAGYVSIRMHHQPERNMRR